MKILKKIFNYYGYSITRKHKTESLKNLIQLRLKSKPCECLIDVGCNVGDFLDDFNTFFKKSYAFEPNNELIPLVNNRFLNKKNISVYNLGVGEKSETSNLYITNDKGKTLSSIKKQNKIIEQILRNTEVVKKNKIEITSLYDFIMNKNLQNKSFFLKTDTQGNDLEVLLGLKKFIKNVNFIKIEMPVINIYDIDYKFDDINEFMKINDFNPLYFQHLSRNSNGELIEYDVVFERTS